jgi:hypothetical protein
MNSTPSCVSRGLRVSTRTSCPAARSLATTFRPRVPVPPVTNIGVVMESSLWLSHLALAAGHSYDPSHGEDVTDGRERLVG